MSGNRESVGKVQTVMLAVYAVAPWDNSEDALASFPGYSYRDEISISHILAEILRVIGMIGVVLHSTVLQFYSMQLQWSLGCMHTWVSPTCLIMHL